jgi:flagellar basal-body rod protein FlgB
VIEGMFNGGTMPLLERMVQFTSRRHQLLAHNIANLSTPDFQPADVSPQSFQQALADAVDQRRRSGPKAELKMTDTREMTFGRDTTTLHPQPLNQNVLFHDRNNRSLEHQMKALAENTMAHNAALELLAGKFTSLETAIRGQI